MNRTTFFTGLFVVMAASAPGRALAQEADFDYPPTLTLEQVRGWIDGAHTGHPRLLATKSDLAALGESSGADPLRRAVAEAVTSQADRILQQTPVTRTLQGRRLLGQSRRCVGRVLRLAAAYHLTGDARYAERCKQEMLAAGRFSDWNPSHFLDVAEMTFALAIGYDWLYDRLDEASRKEIRTAIVQKGVALPFQTRHTGWIRAANTGGRSATAVSWPAPWPSWRTSRVWPRGPCITPCTT